MKLEKLIFTTESGKSIELTADEARCLFAELEARCLFAELSELFGEPIIATPQYIPPVMTRPTWIKWPEVTCGTKL